MANIIITENCNQHCPYCFASEVMEKKDPNIKVLEFKRVMDFILRTDKHFGVIGGEPLLHPEIDTILAIIIDDRRVEHATIFTNGTCIDRHIKLLTHPKLSLLVNFNSEKDAGLDNYNATLNNLRMMSADYRMGYKLTLGLNIYSPDQDLDYFISAAKEFGVKNIRVSITVPPKKNIDFREYFKSFIPMIKRFLSTMNHLGIAVTFDCNLIPICLIDNDLKRLMSESENNPACGRRYVSTDRCSRCNPVIDIDTKGTAIRCFGLSDGPHYSIWDFNDLPEIRARMVYDIDNKAIGHAEGKCADCHDNLCQKCFGGCIAFRLKNSGINVNFH